MVIEINKDIDRYKETVIMGLTARQLIFSALSIAVGGGIVLFFYPLIGLTPSVYIAIPAVAPVALGGFYSYNGMNFYEYMGRKLKMLFANRPLAYVSTEGEQVLKEIRMQEKEKALWEKTGRRRKAGMKKIKRNTKLIMMAAIMSAAAAVFMYKARRRKKMYSVGRQYW